MENDIAVVREEWYSGSSTASRREVEDREEILAYIIVYILIQRGFVYML